MGGGKYTDHEILNKVYDESTGGLKTSASGGGSSNRYYKDDTIAALTTGWTEMAFGFTSSSISLANDDDAKAVSWSFDGTNVHGKLLAGDVITMDGRAEARIYLKGSAGGEKYRLIAW